jgi:hypothetical protein
MGWGCHWLHPEELVSPADAGFRPVACIYTKFVFVLHQYSKNEPYHERIKAD